MKKHLNIFVYVLLALLFIGCSPSSNPNTSPTQPSLESKGSETPKPLDATPIPFTLSSPILETDNMVPTLFSCNGKDISLPLAWGEPPTGTKSFALIMDDPDAKAVAGFTWIHWVIFNLPAQARSLTENIARTNTLPDGSIQGKNSFGKIGYGGPCPSSGLHHYYFRLFALDILLDASPGTTSGVLMQKMKNHILAQVELITTYRKH
jgi:Raf kinase inhibitor-like YbhB/YbcL family protein